MFEFYLMGILLKGILGKKNIMSKESVLKLGDMLRIGWLDIKL